MYNYVRYICGGDGASCEELFASIKANFKTATGWQEDNEDTFVCPYDNTAGIKFLLVGDENSKTDDGDYTKYYLRYAACTRQGESYPWVTKETLIITYNINDENQQTTLYMGLFISESGKTFTMSFSQLPDNITVQLIAGLCNDAMTLFAANTMFCRGMTYANTTAGRCYNYSALVDTKLDFMTATMINPVVGMTFDELVKIVSTPYSVNIGQLFKSWEGTYRVILNNSMGILIQSNH